MRMKLVAASLLALGMASGAMAQSSTTTGSGSASDTMMNSGQSNGSMGSNSAAPLDPSATNSTNGVNTNSTGTVDRTRCTPQAAPGAVASQNGNSGASESMACPDSDSQ